MQVALREAQDPRPLVSLLSSGFFSSAGVSPARETVAQELVGGV